MPKLTAAFVAKPNPNRRLEIPDAVQPGIYLVVQQSGARSWAVRYRHQGRPRKYTIGGYPAVTLAAAREAARGALEAVAKGVGPAPAANAARRRATTFEAVAARFIDVYCKQHQKTWEETRRAMWKEVIPLWGDREFASITRAEVNELLHAIVARGAPFSSNRVLAYLRKLWSWGIDEGYTETSPCYRVRPKALEVARDRVLTDAELRIVWAAWQEQDWPWAPMQQLLLITGGRLREISCATWDEVDLDAKLWTLGRDRTKGDRAHVVPLSQMALDVVTSLPRFAGSPFVFPAQRERRTVPNPTPRQARPIAGFSTAKRECDRLIAAAGHEMPAWRWHDLRRTCRTNLSRLRISSDVAEAVIGHAIPGVSGVYDRHDYLVEKREALEAWANLLSNILEPERASNNIVSLRG